MEDNAAVDVVMEHVNPVAKKVSSIVDKQESNRMSVLETITLEELHLLDEQLSARVEHTQDLYRDITVGRCCGCVRKIMAMHAQVTTFSYLWISFHHAELERTYVEATERSSTSFSEQVPLTLLWLAVFVASTIMNVHSPNAAFIITFTFARCT